MDHRKTARPASSGAKPSDAMPRSNFYPVGGAIASMAAAFLIRVDIHGFGTTKLEETDRVGGTFSRPV